jgi:hypothetical protein
MDLMMGDDADPPDEIRTQLKRFVFPPKDHAHFLEYLFRMAGVAQQRYEVRKEPAVVLRK